MTFPWHCKCQGWRGLGRVIWDPSVLEKCVKRGSNPGDAPKDVKPLLFRSDTVPTTPERSKVGHLKLLRAEVPIPGGGRSHCCKHGVMNSVGCHSVPS